MQGQLHLCDILPKNNLHIVENQASLFLQIFQK
jgi:hypothetical protein